MSFENSDNFDRDVNSGRTEIIRFAGELPALRPELKQKVLQACVSARRQRQSDRKTAGKMMMTTVLMMFGLLGFDAFGSTAKGSMQTPVTLVADVKHQQTFVSSSEYALPLTAMADIGTIEQVEHIISVREQHRKRLTGLNLS